MTPYFQFQDLFFLNKASSISSWLTSSLLDQAYRFGIVRPLSVCTQITLALRFSETRPIATHLWCEGRCVCVCVCVCVHALPHHVCGMCSNYNVCVRVCVCLAGYVYMYNNIWYVCTVCVYMCVCMWCVCDVCVCMHAESTDVHLHVYRGVLLSWSGVFLPLPDLLSRPAGRSYR